VKREPGSSCVGAGGAGMTGIQVLQMVNVVEHL
jgi:hypothetical protein